jgi:PPOX class probable FMN-dependent enzyme
MKLVETVEELETLYRPAVPASLSKVVTRLEGEHARWIQASRFVILSTVGPEGTDGSPRGDIGPVARIVDPVTLAIPDWRGNNRLDTLRNIVRDGRISLMFIVPGATSVVRVNGRAKLTIDPDMITSFENKGRHPATVILVTVSEIYVQCSKAILRSDLWREGDRSAEVPTSGDLIAEGSGGRHGGVAYDDRYEERAQDRLW